MIKKIEIENYKSIEKLDIEIGQFNVFIGENGCGKTNILEAFAFASSYLDMENGKLSLKGVRVAEAKFFRSGFDAEHLKKNILFYFFDNENNNIEFIFHNSNQPYSKWDYGIKINNNSEIISENDSLKGFDTGVPALDMLNQWDKEIEIRNKKMALNTFDKIWEIVNKNNIPGFVVYAPENSFLRNYNIDTPYIQPLGTKGEGLLKLIKVIKEEKPEQYKEIIGHLHLIDWFSDIDISEGDLSGTEFKITDAYLEEGIGGFDIRNANEGFFLLLFYITLFVSDYTPSFFAIDNIDTALNPKLCTKLIEILAELAKKHNKQVLITTHNPAILDGINLNDQEQRLFVVSRNNDGFTRVRRIEKKEPLSGEKPMKLSEQFLRGYIGGLPKNF